MPRIGPSISIWLRRRLSALFPLLVLAIICVSVAYDLQTERRPVVRAPAVLAPTLSEAERRAWREWHDELMAPPPSNQLTYTPDTSAAERRAWREWHDELMAPPPSHADAGHLYTVP